MWMTAGLLAYKLCDRQLDCEKCPLDAALRGVDMPGPAGGTKLPVEPSSWEFPDDRLYHPAHAWVKAIDGNRVRCGLDMFAGELLTDVKSIVLPAVGSRLKQGRIGCWLAADADFIPVLAPVSGTVVLCNGDVQYCPALMAESPYDEGWLIEVRCRTSLDQQENLLSGREMKELADGQMASLHEQAARLLEQGNESVGTTLADGGERLTDLRRALGPERYRRLLLGFLA